MFIPREQNSVVRAEEEQAAPAVARTTSFLSGGVHFNKRSVVANRRTFVFAQKKAQGGSGEKTMAKAKPTSQMPKKLDSLLRSSSLVKLLKDTSKKNPKQVFGTQAAIDLSNIINRRM